MFSVSRDLHVMSGILDIKIWFDHLFKFSNGSEYAYSEKVLYHLLCLFPLEVSILGVLCTCSEKDLAYRNKIELVTHVSNAIQYMYMYSEVTHVEVMDFPHSVFPYVQV